MDRITVLATQSQRFLAVAGVEHVVSGLFQNLTRKSANDVLVFHEQDGFRSAWCGSFHTRPFCRFLVAVEMRQVDFDCRATVWLAINPDVAAALLHDSVNSRQPETSTAAFVFSRKERFKNSALGLDVHPATGIADREHDVAARRQCEKFA